MKQTQKGFTLVELLVAISIIGLLASVVLSAVNGARKKAVASQINSTAEEFRKAFVLGYDKYGGYPTYSGSNNHCLGTPPCGTKYTVVTDIVGETMKSLPPSMLYTFTMSFFTFYAPNYSYAKCATTNGSIDDKNACNTATIIWATPLNTCGAGRSMGPYTGSVPLTYQCWLDLD